MGILLFFLCVCCVFKDHKKRIKQERSRRRMNGSLAHDHGNGSAEVSDLRLL